jgi:hypothetical protein
VFASSTILALSPRVTAFNLVTAPERFHAFVEPYIPFMLSADIAHETVAMTVFHELCFLLCPFINMI